MLRIITRFLSLRNQTIGFTVTVGSTATVGWAATVVWIATIGFSECTAVSASVFRKCGGLAYEKYALRLRDGAGATPVSRYTANMHQHTVNTRAQTQAAVMVLLHDPSVRSCDIYHEANGDTRADRYACDCDNSRRV